jgi:hypothetical protein
MDFLRRLSSFAEWPTDGSAISPVTLACAGFVYSGRGLEVACPVCHKAIDVRQSDVVLNARDAHRLMSPQCFLALECSQPGSRLSCASVSTLSESQMSSSGTTNGERFTVTSDAAAGVAGTPVSHSLDLRGIPHAGTARSSNGLAQDSNASDPIDRKNPDFGRLKSEGTRLGTFHDWPTTANVRPAELAADGWFFTGRNDRVCCAFCRGFLHNWAKNDEPASEHRRHFPDCPFVKGRDVGNVPLAKAKTAAASEQMQPRGEQWSANGTSCGDLRDGISCRIREGNGLLQRHGHDTVAKDTTDHNSSRMLQMNRQSSSPWASRGLHANSLFSECFEFSLFAKYGYVFTYCRQLIISFGFHCLP